MADGILKVRIVSPEREVFRGEASSVVAPAWDGQVGILPRHAPLMTLVGQGMVVVDLPGGGSEDFFVAGGVLKIEGDELILLTEYAGEEAPEELPPGAEVEFEEFEEDETGGTAAYGDLF